MMVGRFGIGSETTRGRGKGDVCVQRGRRNPRADAQMQLGIKTDGKKGRTGQDTSTGHGAWRGKEIRNVRVERARVALD